MRNSPFPGRIEYIRQDRQCSPFPQGYSSSSCVSKHNDFFYSPTNLKSFHPEQCWPGDMPENFPTLAKNNDDDDSVTIFCKCSMYAFLNIAMELYFFYIHGA
uniref:Uncharacterized protein n=1 Tax=Glossina pallidipes TaxID=7398 RepID=A0A1A9Z811_GLOPL